MDISPQYAYLTTFAQSIGSHEPGYAETPDFCVPREPGWEAQTTFRETMICNCDLNIYTREHI